MKQTEKKVEELAELIVGKLYTPPPMSPKLLAQEKSRIIPWLTKALQQREEKVRKEVVEEVLEKIKKYQRIHFPFDDEGVVVNLTNKINKLTNKK